MQKKTEKNLIFASVVSGIRDCFNTIKNVNGKVLSAVLAAVMLISAFAFITEYYTFGYNVYYGDVNVGVSTSKTEAMEAYTEAACDVAQCNRGRLKGDLKFVMTIASVSDITDSDIYHGIVEAAEGKEACYGIMAGEVTVANVKTRDEAESAIERYVSGFEREDATIFSDYEIVATKEIITRIVSEEEAVRLIEESNLFTVVYKDVTEEEVEIPFTETIIEDETLPGGMEIVEQEGVAGSGVQRNITFYENGVKKHDIDPIVHVSIAPVERIVRLGTNEMSGLKENSINWPAEGRFTSDFGRRWGRNHNGIDIAADPGTPIYAPAIGVVTFSDTRSGYGNYIVIDHGDGYVTTYAHMTKRLVNEGDVVAVGQQIGTVGSTGRVTGPHLHFEVLHGGVYVDPMIYIAG